MPNSSRILIVCLDVSQAGAVQPLGFFPRKSVRFSTDFAMTSRCCCSLNVETNSWQYPWRPLAIQWDKVNSRFLYIHLHFMARIAHFLHLAWERFHRMRRHKPCCFNPVPVQHLEKTINANSSAKDATRNVSRSSRCAWTSIDPRAIPVIAHTVQNNHPVLWGREGSTAYQPLTASTLMPYPTRTLLTILIKL